MRRLALVFLMSGCYSSHFVATGKPAAPSTVAPEVFTDSRPARAFHSIGWVEVEADPMISEATVRKVAAREGQRRGCEVLVERRLMPVSSLFRNLRQSLPSSVLVAHDGDEPRSGGGQAQGGSQSGRSDPTAWRHREFACGVFDR